MWCPHLIQRARMSTAHRLHQELIQICRCSQVSLTARWAKWIKHILTRAFKAFRTLILTKTLVLFSGHKKKGTAIWPPRINIAHIRIQIARKLMLKAISVQLQATRMCTTRSKGQVRAQPSPTTQVDKAPFAASWLSRGSTTSSNSSPKTSPRATWTNSWQRFSNNKTYSAIWSNQSRSNWTTVLHLCQKRSPKYWAERNMDQTRAPTAHLKTSLRVVEETMATLSLRVLSASSIAVIVTAFRSFPIFNRASRASQTSLWPCTNTKTKVWERRRNQLTWILKQFK